MSGSRIFEENGIANARVGQEKYIRERKRLPHILVLPLILKLYLGSIIASSLGSSNDMPLYM